MSKRYEEEFKKQIVTLFNNGKRLADLNREFGVAKSTIKEWVERFNKNESFKAADNRTEEENELIKLKKENKNLKMENDILKQAALILGQK